MLLVVCCLFAVCVVTPDRQAVSPDDLRLPCCCPFAPCSRRSGPVRGAIHVARPRTIAIASPARLEPAPHRVTGLGLPRSANSINTAAAGVVGVLSSSCLGRPLFVSFVLFLSGVVCIRDGWRHPRDGSVATREASEQAGKQALLRLSDI